MTSHENRQYISAVLRIEPAPCLPLKVILKMHVASFPDASMAVYTTSNAPGTEKRSPDCLVELTDGDTPELSVTVGSCQLTLTSTDVAFSIAMSLGQYVNTGASWSKSKVTVYVIC